ncbi:MAG TPA: peptide ABC transporter substrate-binding protein [Ktedonobacterales bacterium]|nr:peptide ABC transporter substrate-binding protein [Ktedonobacterales bacterium]
MLRKRGLWSAVLGLGVTVTMLLSACGPTASTSGGGIKNGGSLVDGISQEPSSLMIGQSTQAFAALVEQSIWAPLIYTDDKYNLDAGLLTQVPSGANGGDVVTGTTEKITLKLRANLKWSDGQALTSDDVAFAIATYRDATYGAKTGFDSLKEIATVETPDKLTTVITLNDVDVAFLASSLADNFVFSPLPKHHYSSMTPAQIAADFQPAVTSGPFTVSERVKGDHITVVKNTNYYQAGKPHLNQITFKFFPDANTIVTALQAGQVDSAYFLPVSSADVLKNIPGYKFFQPKQGGSWEAWYFNLSNSILADIKVREALAMSFDPNTEVTQIQHGNAAVTCDDGEATFVHEPSLVQTGGFCAYGPDQHVGLDVAGAKTLLAGDGWTAGSDGILVKDGTKLSLRISTTSGRQYRLDSEALAKAAWKAIGVDINIVNHPSSDLFGPVLFPSDTKYQKSNDQWDIAEFANNQSTPDPDNHTIWSSDQVPPAGGSNLTYYNNSSVDALEKQQLTQTNVNDRKATFHQIHVQILKDIPTFYLYAALDISEYKNTLHNYSPIGGGGVEDWNVWDWYLGAAQ